MPTEWMQDAWSLGKGCHIELYFERWGYLDNWCLLADIFPKVLKLLFLSIWQTLDQTWGEPAKSPLDVSDSNAPCSMKDRSLNDLFTVFSVLNSLLAWQDANCVVPGRWQLLRFPDCLQCAVQECRSNWGLLLTAWHSPHIAIEARWNLKYQYTAETSAGRIAMSSKKMAKDNTVSSQSAFYRMIRTCSLTMYIALGVWLAEDR